MADEQQFRHGLPSILGAELLGIAADRTSRPGNAVRTGLPPLRLGEPLQEVTAQARSGEIREREGPPFEVNEPMRKPGNASTVRCRPNCSAISGYWSLWSVKNWAIRPSFAAIRTVRRPRSSPSFGSSAVRNNSSDERLPWDSEAS